MKTAIRVALALCKRFEGLSLKPYLCPAGVWTNGYGTVFKPDGSRVSPDDPQITADVAELWLIKTLQNDYLPSAVRLSPVLIGQEEALGAIADFIYNLGAGRYKVSTLRRRINAGEWDEAEYEINRWVRANGKILRGLVLRRQAEAKHFKIEF